MPDEWNTLNIKPGKGGVLREIEILRKQYADHHSTLERLAEDAPTENLAKRYRELIRELEESMARVTDLELGIASESDEIPADDERFMPDPPRARTEARHTPPGSSAGGLRTLLIVLAGIFMIAILGLLLWNWAFDGVEPAGEPEIAAEIPEPVVPEEPEPPPPEPDLTIAPEAQEFGNVRRGARAARQYEVENHTDATLPIQVERSDCRCLWFEYADTIPPRGTTTLTVTIDGARAPVGPLRETVRIRTRTEPPITATLEARAMIAPAQ